MTKILFVCMGNICRSPAAEGVMRALVNKNNLGDKVYCESAGTSSYHVGDLPDARMREHAARRGYVLESLARQFVIEDFDNFDYIVTMDHSNYRNVMRLDPSEKYKSKVLPMSHLCEKISIDEVPDPYSGGDAGFEEVLDIVEDGCSALLRHLEFVK